MGHYQRSLVSSRGAPPAHDPDDLVENIALQSRIGLVYADECLYIQAVFERSEFSDREIEPEDSVFVNIVFKYLGGVSRPAKLAPYTKER